MRQFKLIAILLVFSLTPTSLAFAYSARQKLQQSNEMGSSRNSAQVERSLTPDDYINQGNQLVTQGRWDEAIKAYKEAIKRDPNSGVAYNQLGVALSNQGRWDEAIEAYRQATILRPQDVTTHKNLSGALESQGLLNQAIEAYRKIIELQPNSAVVCNNFGILLKKGGRLPEAIEAYNKAIALDSNYATAYDNLGTALSEQGRLPEAIEAHKKALSISSNNTWFINNLGTALIKVNRLDEALKLYQEAVTVHPKNAELHYKLSLVLKMLDHFESAQKACDLAVEINPNYKARCQPTDEISQGNRLRTRGRLREAVEAYQNALKLNPNSDIALNELGVTLLQQHHVGEAIDEFRKAIKIKPTAEAYNNLGMALREQGRLDEAEQAYRSALNINPEDTAARNNLSVLLDEKGDRNRALEEAKEAVKRDPSSALAYNNLGNALRTQGELDQAIKAYRQALSLPDNPKGVQTKVHNGLGYTLQLQGKLEAAIEEYRQALLLDPNFVPAQNNFEEVQRLLKIGQNPLIGPIIDTNWLPPGEPLVPVLRSVVRVVAPISTGRNRGTGWVVERKGNRAWILTNRHVVMDQEGAWYPNKEIGVEFYSVPPPDRFHQRLPAELIKFIPLNDELDLALLEVADIPDDVQPLSISTERMSIDTEIRVIGHPSSGLAWTVERGRINALDTEELQISRAALATGNSGSPVLDAHNRVVGIVYESITPNPSNDLTAPLAFAYPMQKLIERIQAWGICWRFYEHQDSHCQSSNLEH